MTKTAITWCRSLTTSPSAVLAGEDACRGMTSSALAPPLAAASLAVALAARVAKPIDLMQALPARAPAGAG
jgi:hypothetical protein